MLHTKFQDNQPSSSGEDFLSFYFTIYADMVTDQQARSANRQETLIFPGGLEILLILGNYWETDYTQSRKL